MGSYSRHRFEYIDLDDCAETRGRCSKLRGSCSQREPNCNFAQTARMLDRRETAAKISTCMKRFVMHLLNAEKEGETFMLNTFYGIVIKCYV